ncbi:hypothetical protein NE236_24485 [Actinoallomurus purpureus]|uniref:hypothetical protein n=1 Tax=Actinoallomurus purpureus TaxID=478114 RepID=UPI00209339FD|nr:hypothetical protein [Actinoallomurus purpureus]MCO6008143.1 hypothetical protein [Actinoallomurus purpureus]
MTLHYDADSIYVAAKSFVGEPLAHMKAAELYAKNDTDLSWHALGAIGFPAINAYNSCLAEMRGNLAGGVKTIQKIADSLVIVARNYSNADKYGTIAPFAAREIPYSPVVERKPDYTASQSGWAAAEGLAALASFGAHAGWYGNGMRANFVIIRSLLLAETALEPLCAVALGLWAMFSPSDVEVDKAIESWIQIERQLDAVQKSVDNVIGVNLTLAKWGNDAQKGDNARQRFDEFMKNSFSAELNESKERAKTTYTSLIDLKKEVNRVQAALFVSLSALSATLAAAWVAQFWPPMMAVAKAVKAVCASLIALSVAGAVAVIAGLLSGTSTTVQNLWFGTEERFPANRMNPDGSVDFNDVNKMDWHWGEPGQVK